MKMKSERPLLIRGVPQTEFETTDQHGKELIAAKLAVEDKGETLQADLAPVAEPAAEPMAEPAIEPAVDLAPVAEPATTGARKRK